jgi:hypothetical protein
MPITLIKSDVIGNCKDVEKYRRQASRLIMAPATQNIPANHTLDSGPIGPNVMKNSVLQVT